MSQPTPLNTFSSERKRKQTSGFALVVTLTLMVLLSILALGMLSLASVNLRSSGHEDSQAAARANAMLALQIAIGELQAAAGPDQRITAAAEIRPGANQKKITGVWESLKLGPGSTPTDFTENTKTDKFVKWLVSGTDQDALELDSFVDAAVSGDSIELMTAVNLEPSAPTVVAQKVPVKGSDGKLVGRYAFAVLDEGIKARINLGVKDPGTEFASRVVALGSGQRPGIDRIEDIGTIDAADVDLSQPSGQSLTSKLVSLGTSEFAYGSGKGTMTKKSHDLTSNSLGVLSDVANGGLKLDFILLADRQNGAGGSLPSEYAGKGIYEQSFETNLVSDPLWNRALAWGNVFNNPALSLQNVNGTSTPVIKPSIPTDWAAGTGVATSGTTNSGSATLSEVEPPGPVLLPTVAKVQMSFALALRDVYRYNKGDTTLDADANGINKNMHGPWDDHFQKNQADDNKKFDSPFDYLMHMVYSPIITLHNPYNIPITFEKLRVEFVNVPLAFQVYKNGIAQQKSPVPFSLMYGSSTRPGDSKRFGLTLGVDSSGNPQPETLLPGEVKVYSPKINPNRTWREEVGGTKQFWDWGNRNRDDGREGGSTATDTSLAIGQPGWNGVNVGYDLDMIAPRSGELGGVLPDYQAYLSENIDQNTKVHRWGGIPVQKDDKFYVESTLLADPKLPEMEFSVEMTPDFTPGQKKRASAVVFEFETPDGLQDAVLSAANPHANGKRIRWPRGTDQKPALDIFDHSTVALKDIRNTEAFALFSASAKTPYSGDSSGHEGLWASKPFSFQNQTAYAVTQDMTTGHPSHHSYELALTPFEDTSVFVEGTTNRARFITGHTATHGRQFGTLFEIPLAPFQSMVTLNSAQLASGVKLPHFFAPVGNSHAHPLIETTEVISSGDAGYDYVDHSFLLNTVFSDSYYFSGFQKSAPGSLAGNGISAETLVDQFINPGTTTTATPLPDTRLTPYYPDGAIPAQAAATLKGTDAYKQAAAYQLVKGAFNVNSTSKAAWKAVLSAMSGEEAIALVNPGSSSAANTLEKVDYKEATDPKGARFSRFRIPNGQADRTSQDGFWRGGIDLTEDELDTLADNIVSQIQQRGPFLSMAEFVNRQLGDSDDTKSHMGVLQAAIDAAGINQGVSSGAASGRTIAEAETTGLDLATPEVLEGDSAQGAPGYLMQSDLLAVLGNAATVRSDTFKIRAYGEALDANGNVIATAYCEAIVQRLPEFLDPANAATDPLTALNVTNKKFGRRFETLSVRWLSKNEL